MPKHDDLDLEHLADEEAPPAEPKAVEQKPVEPQPVDSSAPEKREELKLDDLDLLLNNKSAATTSNKTVEIPAAPTPPKEEIKAPQLPPAAAPLTPLPSIDLNETEETKFDDLGISAKEEIEEEELDEEEYLEEEEDEEEFSDEEETHETILAETIDTKSDIQTAPNNELSATISDSTSPKKSGQMLYENTVQSTQSSIKRLMNAHNAVSNVSGFSKDDKALSDLAMHIMEPKIENWLNQNLPALVEEIVREEIKKILPKS